MHYGLEFRVDEGAEFGYFRETVGDAFFLRCGELEGSVFLV